MNTPKRLLIAVMTLLPALSPLALADDVDCPPNLGAVTIDGNVIVTGACRLDGTTVIGNVHLHAGGSLIARNARIDGNIQAENSIDLDVQGSQIGGSVQLDNLVGNLTVISTNTIDGSIQLNSNRSDLEIRGNIVGADIQAFENRGGLEIRNNTVDGNLQCKENEPAPFGGGNIVRGNSEDQCARLDEAGGGTGGGGLQPPRGDRACAGTLGAVRIDDNLVVTSACRLEGTHVEGNVLLYTGGSLVAVNARVDGNLQADRALYVDVLSSEVDGDIQLDELVGAASRVEDTRVGGNIQAFDNRYFLNFNDNRVTGDLQAFSNRGGLDITANVIGGNLQCQSNVPAPTGGSNTVGGNREDQCANLRPATAPLPGPGSTAAASGSTASGGGVSAAADGGGGGVHPLALGLLAALALFRRRRT